MASHQQEVILPYTSDQMFDLVSDIKRYPEFVRWVTALRVLEPREENGVHYCIGEAVVAFKGFANTFATSVATNRAERTVNVGLVKGPLKHLKNEWRFTPEGEGKTRVFFSVDYEFNNFLLRALARANHQFAIDKIMGTFLAEAKRRYGTEKPA